MLRGRRAEQERIDALLDAARAGLSAALVVRGEAGIGKTALLDHAAERADGMRVLRGAGIESEAELPFAGLHLLLRPAVDDLGAHPGPQRQALSGAFGLGAGGGDRALREDLITETRGNPLALRELPPLVATHGARLGVIPLTGRVLGAADPRPRTVAYHVYKAYPKLGVSSRGEPASLSEVS